VTILVTTAGFVVPYAVLDAILGELMPPKHDMSDLSTGVIRLMFSTAGGVVGALAAYAILRRRRREGQRDQRRTDS
jgi:ABC-type xylose transport system permease subunit